MRLVFLKHIPRLLRMRRPGEEEDDAVSMGAVPPGVPIDSYEAVAPIDKSVPPTFSSFKVSKPNPKQVIHNMCNDLAVVANHYRQEDYIEEQKDDWRYIGIVIDRVFFWIFSLVITLGTVVCFVSAPAIYDRTIPVEELVRKGLAGQDGDET